MFFKDFRPQKLSKEALQIRGSNFPGGGGWFPGGNFLGGTFPGGIFPGAIFPGGIFPSTVQSSYFLNVTTLFDQMQSYQLYVS